MSEAIKNTDNAPKLGSTQGAAEFSLLSTRIRQKEQSQKHTAAMLSELEEFAQDALETQASDGKEAANNVMTSGPLKQASDESAEASSAESSSGTPTEQKRFGGSDFYVSNNIPFEMFVDMMEQRLKQLNTQSETQQMISLAYAGKDKTTSDDGSVSFSDQEGGGIVNMLSSNIMESANDDSMSTLLAGTQAMSAAGGQLGGLMASFGGGNTNKEDAEVNKYTNALAADKEIPVANNVTAGDDTGRANAIGKDPVAMEDAISSLKDGTFGDIQLGSVKSVSAKGKKVEFKAASKDSQEYLAQEEGSGDLNAREYLTDSNGKDANGVKLTDPAKQVTTREALEHSSATERREIRKTLQGKLDKAKEALLDKRREIVGNRQKRLNLGEALGKAGGAGVQIQSQIYQVEKGQQEALKQSNQAIQGTLGKIGDTQKSATDADRQRIDQANQDLQKIIQIVGQRG